MLGNFTSNLNSPFFSNKHELIQVLVTANVTIHKYLKAKAMEASIGFSFIETARVNHWIGAISFWNFETEEVWN